MTLSSLRSNFLKLIFPPACASCRKALPHGLGHLLICRECLSQVKPVTSPVCSICGIPFESRAGKDHACGACIRRRPVYGRARALFLYEGAVKNMLHRIKFREDTFALRVMGELARRALEELDLELEGMMVIPVPLHISRLRQRGFNQSQVIAERLFQQPLIHTGILERQRATRPQMELPADERRKNITGAFRVRRGEEKRVHGKKVLLFDDILTTGSTVSAAASALASAGAKEVKVLAAARVRY